MMDATSLLRAEEKEHC